MSGDALALLDCRVALAEGVVLREFPTETIVLHAGRGLYYSLNETAAAMLRAVTSAPQARAAVAPLAAEHAVAEGRVAADLAGLLRRLADRHLIDLDRVSG